MQGTGFHLVGQWWQQQQQQMAGSWAVGTLTTPLPWTLLAVLAVVLLVPRLRHAVLDLVETVVASFLLLVLITVVLGLPFAAVYITFKGVAFSLRSILSNLPSLQGVLSLTAQQVAHHS